MTAKQQSIILVSIIGTILAEYKGKKENTAAVLELKRVCSRFMNEQSGVILLPFIGPRIVDKGKHKQFVNTVLIGDKIWQKALNRYAKNSVTFDAVSAITSIFSFAPELLAKHAHISKKRIAAYEAEGSDGSDEHKTAGCIVGGYLNEMLSEAMGIKVNGRLKALKAKAQNEIRMAA